MEVFTKTELLIRKAELIKKIKSGCLFIYPTDTIYGIGCDASNEKSVFEIRKLKQRPDSPFSILVPGLDWIKENCSYTDEVLEKLPGPYTFLLPMKKKSIAGNVNPKDDTIGVRLPDHWFSAFVADLGFPIITTSANVAGQPFMTDLNNLNKSFEKEIEFIIYEGEKQARPSKIINLSGEITRN